MKKETISAKQKQDNIVDNLDRGREEELVRLDSDYDLGQVR